MKKVIFIIDEKPVHLPVLRDFLSTKYDVFVYREGRAAFRAALREKPDLILLDSQISDIDSHELCRLFKEHQALPKTRLVMLYPRIENLKCKRCYEFGADDYMVKPCFEHELLIRIRVLLKTPRFLTLPESFPIFNKEGIGYPTIAFMMA